MSLRRILKSGGSLVSAQGVNVITQLLLPPIFLRRYGVAAYGEWLTLTAAVAYLSTLNFGLQTYTNNQVAICYNRGELNEAKTIQSTTKQQKQTNTQNTTKQTTNKSLLPVDVWLGMKLGRGIVEATLYL